jgi:hypothetical protein
LATLTEAERIAVANGDREAITRVRAEVGYVDFLRARYDRAERSLGQVLAEEATFAVRARQGAHLPRLGGQRPGGVPRATDLLRGRDQRLARGRRATTGGVRPVHAGPREPAARQTWSRPPSSSLLPWRSRRGDHWLSFLPWPQALLGQAGCRWVTSMPPPGTLEQSFARACQIGDPCWEGISARGLALLAEERGDVDRAFAELLDARGPRQPSGPTPTCGSTCTSSMRCATSGVATDTR